MNKVDNNDNVDDLLFLTQNMHLFSPVWEKPIVLDHSDYKHIFTEMNAISNSLNIF